MSMNKRIGDSARKEKTKLWQIAVYLLFISSLVTVCAVLQTTCLSFFGKVPALTLALVCSVGFIMGERWGALCGLAGGVLTALLGHGGFSFAPIIYTLCGYFCGALIGWFLSKNLLSFIVYALISGAVNEIFTLVYYGLFSRNMSVFDLFLNVIVPEYLGYIICILPAYFAVLAVFSLFKGKDKRGRRA